MPGLFSKIVSFARTPAGQKAIRTATQKAQQMAKDRKNHGGADGSRGRGGASGTDVPPTSH